MYSDGVFLAPMVRQGTLPTRLVCLDYGADLVFCEEIIDFRILSTNRVENRILNTVDFIKCGEKYPVFRTCAQERSRVIFQIGTSSSERAVAVGKMVENDIAGFDINMGCPKSFSVNGGMGAALLENPEKVQEILTSLVSNLSVPVTCKIRILPRREDTMELVKLIERSGVAALTVHGRLKYERPRHNNHNDVIRDISQLLSIPVIANGGSGSISCYEDIEKFKLDTGASSVMIGRAAQKNPSIFRKSGRLSQDTMLNDVMRYCVQYDSVPQNCKYVVQQLIGDQQTETEWGRNMLSSDSLDQICSALKFQKMYTDAMQSQRDRAAKSSRSSLKASLEEISNGSCEDVIILPTEYSQKHFKRSSAKQLLNDYHKQKKLNIPSYSEVKMPNGGKRFKSIVTVHGGKRFEGARWDKNKRAAEQSAALNAILGLELGDLLPEACIKANDLV